MVQEDDPAVQMTLQSGFFDENWYIKEYPDVAEQAMTAIDHFMWIGWRLQRNPGPDFSARSYLSDHPDVAEAGLNPLLHYLTHGKREKRRIKRFDGTALPEGYVPKFDRSQESDREAASRRPANKVLLLSGEPLDRPGALYRIQRMAESFLACGREVEVFDRDQTGRAMHRLDDAAILYIWRGKWEDIKALCAHAKRKGVPYFFDIDDLMVRPDLATAEYIDAIRFNKHDEAAVKKHYTDVRESMIRADYCTASTHQLAWHMRNSAPRRPTFVIPNTYDANTYRKSRLAARKKAAVCSDGKIRIGYASGSRTHQADFKLCSNAVARILRENPMALLVLFRRNTLVTLDITEYPELAGLEDRIEWREFVPLTDLPLEVARFDINLAPLENGNPFCESKSELKYFEAAIADVPTIASPTGPFARAIDHERTGFLADTEDRWYKAMNDLVKDKKLRMKIAHEAHLAALWDFGPTRRAELVSCLLDQIETPRRLGHAMHFEQHIQESRTREISFRPCKTLAHYDRGLGARVAVVIPLYNYENYIVESLESVKAQSMEDIELIIVDDKSTDGSAKIVQNWLERNHNRFGRATLVQHKKNAGLGHARNTGFNLADTLYIMALDADNLLHETCCEVLHEHANANKAAFACSVIQQFGDDDGKMGQRPFNPTDFVPGNTIDAMAMISKEVWSFVGGYATHRMGWQDYDFWCRIVDKGLHGVHVDEVLSSYRVHGKSMLRTATDRAENKDKLISLMEDAFPWLSPIDARQGHRVPFDD